MAAQLKIYTDGGCAGNPGPGGWAFVFVKETAQGKKIIAQRKGAEEDTTNNRMELTAVIKALRSLKRLTRTPGQISLYTDSQYVQKGITDWIRKWKRNDWKNSDREPVKNQDLWKELDALNAEYSIKWLWVKGHAGNEFNERCDELTQQAIAAIV